MRQTLAMADRFAATEQAILVTGETGTGKELLAHYIHQKSGRKGDLIAVNCANLSESLFEAELFGHQKGSFTGATATGQGMIQAAEGGTLFLDEVGELSLQLQARLLRVLQERRIRPVGAVRERFVDFRVVGATHRNLEQMVKEGRFREDLFYRIDVLRLHLPPLRERGEDIVELARKFVSCFENEVGIGRRMLSRDAEACLRGYHWPGNIRELKRTLLRASLITENQRITSDTLRGLLVAPDAPGSMEDRLQALLVETGSVGISDIERITCLHRSSAIRLVRRWIAEGRLEPTGASRARRYRLPSPAVSNISKENKESTGKSRVMELATRSGRITRATLLEQGFSERTASRLLSELVESGKLVRDGQSGRGCGYTLRE